MAKESVKRKHMHGKPGQSKIKQVSWYKTERNTRLMLAGILLLTLIIYFPSFFNDFTNWDDDLYVTENPYISGFNWETISYYFSNTLIANYHPLTLVSLAIDYQIGGDNPFVYHLVNILFHLFNIVLVFYFSYLIFNKKATIALITALIFAIHPMHVESVAWISERKDVLYTFFFILGLITYHRHFQTKKPRFYIYTILLFVLSALSKPAAVVFPLVLIAMDFFSKRKDYTRLILEKIPFFVIAAIFGLITMKAQEESSAVGDFGFFSFFERIRFASYGLYSYLVKFIIPYKLSSFHPYPDLKNIPLIYNISLVINLIIGVFLFLSYKKSRLYIFSYLFYLFNLVLVLQFISVGNAITAERYTYVPYIGLAFIAGYGVHRAIEQGRKSPVRFIAISILAIFTVFYSVISFQRVQVWKNSEVLWSNVIENYPEESGAYNNRGHYYRQIERRDLAIKDYNKSLELKPKNHLALNNRGKIYFDMGENEKALEDYNRSIEANPNFHESYSNRAAVYGQMGKLDKALEDANKALSLKPDYPSGLRNRALIYGSLGDHEKARDDYAMFLQFNPGDHSIWNAKAVEWQHLQNHAEAINDFTRAIRLDPGNGLYYMNRSYSYYAIGNKTAAKNDALQAQRLGVKVDPAYMNQL